MGARIRKLKIDDRTKLRIKTSQIINRLQSHIDGTIELKATQVTAGLGLLKKVVPDLAAVQHTGEDGGPLKVEVVKFGDD